VQWERDRGVQTITSLLTLLAYIGGTGAVVFALFQFLGTKWLETKFAERLESFKHEKARELESLKLEINSTFSRVAKLHEREFEVLPKLWEKLHETDIALKSCVMKFSQFPDLDRLSEEELDAFLAATKLSDFEKDRLRKEPRKVDLYTKMTARQDIYDARNRFADFQAYLRLNRLFIRPELTSKLDVLAAMMWKQWVNIHMAERHPERDSLEGHVEYENASKVTIAEIEKSVHARLYPTSSDSTFA
jgi:hypothetical protein